MASTSSLSAEPRVGSQLPGWTHRPQAVSSDGRYAIELAEQAGLYLDEWQQWVLDGMLAKTATGRWAAFEAALIVPRQNGKNVILEALELAGLFLFEERTIVHSAHKFDTCTEHFMRMRELIEGNPQFSKRLARNGVVTANGKEAVKLKSGARLKFLARSRGGGRGFTGDRIVLDEAYDLPAKAMGAMIPTLAAKSMHSNVQVIYTSSSPHSDSVVLHGLRSRGRSDDAGKLFYAEWGNDDGVDELDRDAWYAANPGLGVWISEEFVDDERRSLESSPGEFARERLGVADPLPTTDVKDPKLPAAEWAATATDTVFDIQPGEITLAYDVTKEGEASSVAIAAGDLSAPYVECIDDRAGVGWLPAELVRLVHKWDPIAVGVNAAGEAGGQVASILEAFRNADPPIPADLLHPMSQVEYKQACGGFYTDVTEGRLRRRIDGPLDRAGGEAAERTIGAEGGWAWDRRSSTVSIAPLVAATIARALLPTEVEQEPESDFIVI